MSCRACAPTHGSRGHSHGTCLALRTSSNLAGADEEGGRQDVETSDGGVGGGEKGGRLE